MASWQSECIPMLRVIIHDLGETPTYTDSRLKQVLIVSAHLLEADIKYSTTYVASISSCTITPDPVDNTDVTYMNFLVIKAACIIDQGQYRTEALRSGIKAKFGESVLETVYRLPGFKDLLTKGPCAAYNTMKDDYNFGSGNICKAILSPFRGNNFSSESLSPNTYR